MISIYISYARLHFQESSGEKCERQCAANSKCRHADLEKKLIAAYFKSESSGYDDG